MSEALSSSNYASLYDHEEELESKVKSEAEFTCENCGSTESYFDGSTSTRSCAICFTQPQSQTEERLEYDDINDFGGRTLQGGLVMKSRREGKGPNRERRRQPLEELDESTPLPTIDVCLEALQQVLKGGVAAVSDVLDMEGTEKKQFEQTTKRIWMAWLYYWKAGAAFYSELYPEVRFSLRDSFLVETHQVMLFRNLSHRANQKLGKDGEHLRTQSGVTEDFNESQDGGSDDDDVCSDNQLSEPVPRRRRGSALMRVVKLHKRNGKWEAALKIVPSMSFAAAVLLAAASPFGVAAYMVVSWIADGRLPLLFAYSSMLSEDQQEETKHVRRFFEMQEPPKVQVLHHHALTLYCIASTEHPTRISLIQSEDAVQSMLGRIIDDLRLGDKKRLFEYSLAIMGLYLDESTRTWLPPQLIQANKLYKMFQFLAVIVIAVKMCPGWERRVYKRKKGIIPWNRAELINLKETEIPAYLDFHEKFIGRNKSCIPELQSSVSGSRASQMESAERKEDDKPEEDEIPVVSWCGAYSARKRRKHHDWYICLRQKEAMWLEANCVGDYLVYPNSTKFHSTHCHYRLLIEHMSQITGVDPSKIHRQATRLDGAVARACKMNVDGVRLRGARPMTDPKEMHRAMVDLQLKIFDRRRTEGYKEGSMGSSQSCEEKVGQKRRRCPVAHDESQQVVHV